MDLDSKRRNRRRYLAAGGLAGVTALAAVGLLVNGSPVALPKLAGTASGAQQATAGGKDGDVKEKDEKQQEENKVPCDADKLIAALVRANADRGAKLELEPKCTYTLTAFQDDNGLPVIVQPVSIDGNGAKIVRAANAERFRIFNVGVGGDLKLRDLTVKGGDARTEIGGGALLVQEGGRATIQDSTLTLNRSDVLRWRHRQLRHHQDPAAATVTARTTEGRRPRETAAQIKNNSAEDDGGGISSTRFA